MRGVAIMEKGIFGHKHIKVLTTAITLQGKL